MYCNLNVPEFAGLDRLVSSRARDAVSGANPHRFYARGLGHHLAGDNAIDVVPAQASRRL